MKFRYFQSRLLLVVFGIALGSLARWVLGPPSQPEPLPQTFTHPISDDVEIDDDWYVPDFKLENDEPEGNGMNPLPEQGGLVPPIRIGSLPTSIDASERSNRDYHHDSTATFEPHGHEQCASGCAASRHPTEKLTWQTFNQLIASYAVEPMDSTSDSLEQLLYYGPQTLEKIQQSDFVRLDRKRDEFLRNQLRMTHAKISIRLIERDGTVRSWLPPTRVPFDRRHVFEMEMRDLQPLVTSGTIKRVGLNHLWARL